MAVAKEKFEPQKKRAKGDILLLVLERISEGITDAATLFGAFLEAGYGASYGKLGYVFARKRTERERAAHAAQLEREAKRRYQQLAYLLKKDGLVEVRERSRRRFFILTRRGAAKLTTLRDRREKMLPPITYGPEKADMFTIVTFDIPEKERKKRDWLRAALKRLDFTFVQKSVWMGKRRIPEEFLEDLQRLNLVDYVEIFQITRTGSLKHVI